MGSFNLQLIVNFLKLLHNKITFFDDNYMNQGQIKLRLYA